MTPITQDQFFSQLFQQGLSDPASKVYLPGIILSTSNPSLNPYTVSSLDLGSQSFGSGITVDVSLSNMSITGLANITVAAGAGGSLQLTGLNIALVSQFCKLSPPPPGVSSTIALNTRFTLSSQVAGSISGSFSVTLNAAALNAALMLSGNSLTDIVITLTSLAVSVPATVTVDPHITFDGGGGGLWATLFQNYLKQQSTIQSIVTQLNGVIGQNLEQLSTELTKILQNALQQQLGQA